MIFLSVKEREEGRGVANKRRRGTQQDDDEMYVAVPSTPTHPLPPTYLLPTVYLLPDVRGGGIE
jgi:hypothetical protein